MAEPEQGDVIPGGNGLRKVRWLDLGRGKGKRGRLRVIYPYLPEIEAIVFLSAYGKGKQSDLTNQEKRILANEVGRIRLLLRRT